MDAKHYQFGHFVLEPDRNRLIAEGKLVTLPEKNLQLLKLLVEASPEPLSKQQLHDALWPDTVVSDWSLSRLVSDTRIAIGDDGEHQSVIKTARGIGFYIPDVEVVETSTPARIVHLWKTQGIWIVALLLAVSGLVYWYHQHQRTQLVESVNRIAQHQEYGFTAFIAQAKRRNQLVEMIEQRLGIERTRQFELFFRHVAKDMNEEERFICQQMRAYSDSGIYTNNLAVLNELEANPALFDEIPLAFQLAKHLRVWIDKYRTVFTERQDMCLVYVGVEDGVPYPSEVDDQIKQWLAQNQTQ